MSFLKQEPPKPDAGIQEFRADSGVHADGSGHLGHIRLGFFTKRGNRIDGGDPLGQKGVGHQFGQFAAPDIGRQDPIFGNPVGVNFLQRAPWPLNRFRSAGSRSAPGPDAPGPQWPCLRREIPDLKGLQSEPRFAWK